MLEKRTSEMYLPATKCLEAIAKVPSTPAPRGDGETRREKTNRLSRPGVFELRAYQLELGYNPIPKLIAHMQDGLSSKLASDPDEKGALIGMFYSDVGRLNRFVEVWRHDSAKNHIALGSRAEARRRGARAWDASRPWCRRSTPSSRSPRDARPRSKENLHTRMQ